jgi:5-methylcytosine-specific restriction enzyme subunit McrC
MLKICEMLQEPAMPQSDAVSDLEVLDWLRKQEPRIFELFVANFYRLNLRGNGWRVSAQRKLEWHETAERRGTGIRLPNMYPDVYLTHSSGKIVVLDTKWYSSPVSERDDSDSVHSNNLYQIYGYLASQDHRLGQHLRSTGILLYGQTEKGYRRLRTRIDEHPFWVETLDLMQDWVKIEADLLELIEEEVGDE